MLSELKNKIFDVYTQGVITDCQVQNWFSKFCPNDILLRDEPRSRWLKKLVECNSPKSTWELAFDLSTSQFMIFHHLKKIRKVSKQGIWVPHTLTEKNIENHISIPISLLSRQKNYPLLKNIITSDENWISYKNVQYKRKWIDKDKSLQPSSKLKLLRRKFMLYVWWDHCGITIYPTPPLRQDMTQGQIFKWSLTGLNSEFSFF